MSTVAGLETGLIVKVEQILDGDATCHCGADAVLLVTTDPDDEPGLVCYEHAKPWLTITSDLTSKLFGPKEA